MDPHAVLLTQAFDADPAVRYLLPDPERRRRVMTHSFASYLRYGGRFGQVDRSPAGAAVWLPDDALPVTLPKLLRCGFAPALAAMGVPALRRTYRFDAVGAEAEGAPAAFAVRAPYPNPAAGRAALAFDLPLAADVTVGVYDVLGREVARPLAGPLPAGRHTAALDAGALAPGTYVVRVAAGRDVATRPLTVVR